MIHTTDRHLDDLNVCVVDRNATDSTFFAADFPVKERLLLRNILLLLLSLPVFVIDDVEINLEIGLRKINVVLTFLQCDLC